MSGGLADSAFPAVLEFGRVEDWMGGAACLAAGAGAAAGWLGLSGMLLGTFRAACLFLNCAFKIN